MSAEALGTNLLREVKVEGLDEVRPKHQPPPLKTFLV